MAAAVSVAFNFVQGAASSAANMNSNYASIVTWLNANAVHLDGSKPFTSIPTRAADATSADQLVRKSQVDTAATIVRLRATSSSQTFLSGVEQEFQFTTVVADTGSLMGPAPQFDIDIPLAGWYAFSLRVSKLSAHTGTVIIRGSSWSSQAPSSFQNTFHSVHLYSGASTVINCSYTQSSGVDQDVSLTLSVTRLTLGTS